MDVKWQLFFKSNYGLEDLVLEEIEDKLVTKYNILYRKYFLDDIDDCFLGFIVFLCDDMIFIVSILLYINKMVLQIFTNFCLSFLDN